MLRTSAELAWDMTEWEHDADLSIKNLQGALLDTFVNIGLALPASIFCRQDQQVLLLKAYAVIPYDATPFHQIDVGFGPMKLKVFSK